MVIEIPRALLISEPWTTVSVGGRNNTRPMVVSLETQDNQVTEQLNKAPAGQNTFRVVDVGGPCYEFEGTGLVKNDLLTVHVESDLKFLR